MTRKITPQEIFRLVQEEKVSRIFAVPTVFTAMIHSSERAHYDLSSLQMAIVGGAPASLTLIQGIEEKFKCQAIAGYGLTETCPVITLGLPSDHMKKWDPIRRLNVQARPGRETIVSEIRVINSEGQEVALNDAEIGEVIVRSNVVMSEYFKDPQATQEAIRDGWFYTGDLATVDHEGSLRIVDRSKDIIISGGENISSAEVENVIYSHPAVLECAVIGVPDDQWGELPLAFVVPKSGTQLTEKEIIEFARSRIAHFKCPKAVHLRESLPKGGTGKILKRELRQPFWEGSEKPVN
jgi:acyl-CoA synthetase (AMP-forming)/AMP-acid ligase II